MKLTEISKYDNKYDNNKYDNKKPWFMILS